MKRGRSTGNPTKAQSRRFLDMQVHGCIACKKHGLQHRAGDVHHVLSGGRRMGHDFTLCLCEWHHRGQPFAAIKNRVMEMIAGPSLHHNSRAFHETYGSDAELLDYQNQLLREGK